MLPNRLLTGCNESQSDCGNMGASRYEQRFQNKRLKLPPEAARQRQADRLRRRAEQATR